MTKKILLFISLFYSFHVFSQKNGERPNIIWITCEDISPFIGAYGDKVVKTPNIDQLAREGILYTHVYTTAGVCAPSRSAIITGMYQNSIGTHHMRTSGDPKYQPVPSYSAVIPGYVKCFPEFLRIEGYYCTNNSKQDYQFEAPVTVWDENGPAASYRNRPDGKPFFSVFNFFITHESQLFLRKDSLLVDPDVVRIPPFLPNTPTARKDMARLYTNIEIMDQQIGELIAMLKEDGLFDNTYIFFFSDHGGALPWMKRELLERGTHIPFIIRFPGGQFAGTSNHDLVSAVDFAPTVLSLAGIGIPTYMQGKAFLGKQKSTTPRKYVFAARDRMDTEYDRVRMVRDKRFRYLYNYMPEKPYYQNIEFRLSIPVMKEILQLRDSKKLDSVQSSWFSAKPLEELYDLEKDTNELHNLVNDPLFSEKLKELRTAFQSWTNEMGDMGSMSEKEMIERWWNDKTEPPVTSLPGVTQTKDGLKLFCNTSGASIGYRVLASDQVKQLHTVTSWDATVIMGTGIKNGRQINFEPAWNVYHGETININKGDTLEVNAVRIGFKPSIIKYVDGKTIPSNEAKNSIK